MRQNMVPGLMILALSGCMAAWSPAAEREHVRYVEKIYLADTDEPEEQKPGFEESITVDGMVYDLEEIQYEVVEKRRKPSESGNIRIETSPPFTDEAANHQPAQTLKVGRETWYLESWEVIDTIIDAREQPVSDVIQYTSIAAGETIPEAAVLTVSDMVTGNEVEVQVPLASASYGEERWEPGFEFPVTIINDDAQRFLLNGTEVELDEEKPLRGYEEQLLELIGVSGENYRITDIRWDGAPYLENGHWCRKLRAMGDWKVTDCKAVYSGTVNLPEVKAKAVQAVYSDVPPAPASEGKDQSIFTMKAVAAYSNALERRPSYDMKRCSEIVSAVLMAVCLALTAGSAGILMMKVRDDQKGAREYQRLRAYANTANVGDIAEEENRENGKENNKGDNKEYRLPAVDEEGLRQRNPDYAAWLAIPDTKIHYPVVWPEDNRKYLKRTFEGNQRACGALFFESSVTPFASFNTIIYGHNMRSGEMFGELKKYLEPSYGREHKDFYICIQGEWRHYELFAVYLVPNGEIAPYQSQFRSLEEVQDFAKSCKENSLYAMDTEMEQPGDILTLSTCSGSKEKLIVQGWNR